MSTSQPDHAEPLPVVPDNVLKEGSAKVWDFIASTRMQVRPLRGGGLVGEVPMKLEHKIFKDPKGRVWIATAFAIDGELSVNVSPLEDDDGKQIVEQDSPAAR